MSTAHPEEHVRPMNIGDQLPRVERLIDQGQVDRYARASGDFNPVHIDNEFAMTSQFGRTIAHGMLIAASISEVMTTAFKVDWLRSGRMKLRFRAPVFPGDTIVAQGEIKDIRERAGKREAICSVDVRKRDGELVISGEVTVSVPLDA